MSPNSVFKLVKSLGNYPRKGELPLNGHFSVRTQCHIYVKLYSILVADD